jgi:hypothetical protein
LGAAGEGRLDLRRECRLQSAVSSRSAEVCGALEDIEVVGLLSHLGNELDPRRSGTDDPDRLPAELHRSRPGPGVVDGSPINLRPAKVGYLCGGQAAGSHDAEPGGEDFPTAGADPPTRVARVEVG